MQKLPVSVLVAIGIWLCFGGDAHAWCSEPDPPDVPSSFSKPNVPYCLQSFSYSRQHSCESYELDNYKSEVSDYVRKLKDFASEAEDFYREAIEYANCEINDVNSQHE